MKRISIYCLLMFCALLTASAQQTKQLVILHTSDTHSYSAHKFPPQPYRTD